MTLKLSISIIRPIDIILESVILDTKVEANIIIYELIKNLKYLILNIENFKLKIVSS